MALVSLAPQNLHGQHVGMTDGREKIRNTKVGWS